MREKALLFGDTKSLVGVVTDPAPATLAEERPGFIILGAGMLHRVGPNRVHVQLARRLAAAGFPTLRFDLSGIGDSRPRDDGLPFAQSAVRETREAMDVLAATRGLRSFVLVGICSGADNGLSAAASDPRVAGAVLIDAYNLATYGRLLDFYRKRILNPRSWARLLTGRSEMWSNARAVASLQRATRSPRPTDALYESLLPSRADYVRQVRSLADRGAQLYLLYTGQSPAYFNYRKLLRRAIRSWPSRQRIRVEHLSETDHVFTLLCNQRRLLDNIDAWARSAFPAPTRAAALEAAASR